MACFHISGVTCSECARVAIDTRLIPFLRDCTKDDTDEQLDKLNDEVRRLRAVLAKIKGDADEALAVGNFVWVVVRNIRDAAEAAL